MKRSSSSPSERVIKVEEKTEETMEDEKPVVTTPPMRECEFCGKKFSSGKALGGHKRFHLQLLRKEKELAEKLAAAAADDGGGGNTKLLSSLDSPPTEKLICCLCNKEFPSEKSLFGHMRSHPGREWRGVHPPTTEGDDDDSMEAALSPITSSSSSVDVAKSLPRSWSRTGIRGREGIFDAILGGIVAIMVEKGHLENKGREEEEGNLVKEEQNSKKKKRVLSDTMNDEVVTTSKSNRKLIVRLKTRPHHEEDNMGADGSGDGDRLPDEEGFKCKICEKSFVTFQALRGHRSSHNKEKKSKNHKDDDSGDGEEQLKSSKNIIEESSESADSKVLRGFDLNEPPENNNMEDGTC
ncbi:hypothetical protein PIB30_057775 [Stylosanthes scabra]|uniref:C2H2-type domain-containing protein n=1 Tax=Stylosanthes scabra TaxID=79078 RepID=A0ABU6RK52_9FABA|nr:hypothetical protein [Stylosanthes scabra]